MHMDRARTRALAASWGRVFLTAVLVTWSAGETDWQAILRAAVLATIPPILRWLNPNDAAYGRTA
jgi:hypothetical protein